MKKSTEQPLPSTLIQEEQVMPQNMTKPESQPETTRQAFLEAEREKWLSTDEAAYVLTTTVKTLMQAIHQGHIRLLAMGRVWRIHVDSLPACQKVLEEWRS